MLARAEDGDMSSTLEPMLHCSQQVHLQLFRRGHGILRFIGPVVPGAEMPAMRLWSLHPRYLDAKGLVALWREALLARAVLRGATRGYRRHPQLDRFREHPAPRQAINAYLAAVHAEAQARGYRFDRSRFGPVCDVLPLPLNEGQLELEWRHLLAKLATRDPLRHAQWRVLARPDCHPLFRLQPGPVAAWERATG